MADQLLDLKITTIEDLKSYSRGAIVELPPFAEGQRFIARLKRPSLLKLVCSGKIGNQLASIATELFMTNAVGTKEPDGEILKKMREVFVIIAQEELVEPTYEQIEAAGVELTDEQLTFLYNYSQEGVKTLVNFR